MPVEVKTGDQLFKKAYLLLQQLWNKDYPGAWNTLNFEWPSGHAITLVDHIKESLKKRIFEMVCQAFKTIHVASLAELLHCSQKEAISGMAIRFFIFNVAVLNVIKILHTVFSCDDAAAISQGAHLCESSEYICLETASIEHRKQKLDGRDIQKLQSILVQIYQ